MTVQLQAPTIAPRRVQTGPLRAGKGPRPGDYQYRQFQGNAIAVYAAAQARAAK